MNTNEYLEDMNEEEFINISEDSKLYPDDWEEYNHKIHAFKSMSDYVRNCAM